MYNPNGTWKVGTHLLQNIIRNYKGVAPSQVPHQHTPYKKGLVLENHIHLKRSPPNMMISLHCFTLDKNNTAQHPRMMKIKKGATIIDKMPETIKRARGHIGWMKHKKTFNVRFEELLAGDAVINQMGEYLGLEPSENHAIKSYGGTSTFTGKYGPNFSVWQTFEIDGKLLWTDEVQEAWEYYGGRELETAWGYDVHKPYKWWFNE